MTSKTMKSAYASVDRFHLIVVVPLIAACLAIATGCSTNESVLAASRAAGGTQETMVSAQQNSKRLARLWESRRATVQQPDYSIGAGDVLEISAQDVDELHRKTVRVSGDGEVNLPLIGTVRAAGYSAQQVSDEIAQKLTKYMYNPQVQVFVSQYHSRQVAVIGAVRAPGLLTLTGSNETILDVLTRSGGTTPDAGDEVLLFPAEDIAKAADNGVHRVSARADSPEVAALDGHGAVADGGTAAFAPRPDLGIPVNGHPISIPLKSTSLSGAGDYLNMPVHPGDVIVVPGGGEVMVIGWVQNPGHFKVGSGLTVLGAIGAAGGPMYAANQSDIELIRTTKSGAKQVVGIDLPAIESGAEPDPPVVANDVIDVPYSSVKIGPYVVYNMLKGMGVGMMAMPIP
jgi:polysaccharide biosynthesis/export protein